MISMAAWEIMIPGSAERETRALCDLYWITEGPVCYGDVFTGIRMMTVVPWPGLL